MKKLSKINEGLWKSGIERSKTGTERLEDKPNTNIEELKEIDLYDDLPFVFADNDIKVNGESKMDGDVFWLCKKEIEKSGWRVPTINDLEKLGDIIDGDIDEWSSVYKRLEFDWRYTYFILDGRGYLQTYDMGKLGKSYYYTNDPKKSELYKIRPIKDKSKL